VWRTVEQEEEAFQYIFVWGDFCVHGVGSTVLEKNNKNKHVIVVFCV